MTAVQNLYFVRPRLKTVCGAVLLAIGCASAPAPAAEEPVHLPLPSASNTSRAEAALAEHSRHQEQLRAQYREQEQADEERLRQGLIERQKQIDAWHRAQEQGAANQNSWMQQQVDHIAEMERLAAQAEYAVPIISREICDDRETLERLRDELNEERRVTAESGVTDLRNRRDIGESAVSTRDEIAGWTARLQEGYRAKPLPCAEVERIFECVAGDAACKARAELLEEVWSKGALVLTGHKEAP